MSARRARRLASLGALCGVALGLLHAAGWGAYFATLPTPRDYPSAAAFDLLTAVATGLLLALGLLVVPVLGASWLTAMVPGLGLTAVATSLFVRWARRGQGGSGPGPQP